MKDISLLADAFLKVARVGRVGSVTEKGRPHVVPVTYAYSSRQIYVGTETKRQWVKNITSNPHVSIAVDEYSDEWTKIKGCVISGNARVITRGPEYQKSIELLCDKYPMEKEYGIHDAVVVVNIKRIACWGLEGNWELEKRERPQVASS
jgi:PPOX class probable F420-dependent enzyme